MVNGKGEMGARVFPVVASYPTHQNILSLLDNTQTWIIIQSMIERSAINDFSHTRCRAALMPSFRTGTFKPNQTHVKPSWQAENGDLTQFLLKKLAEQRQSAPLGSLN
jgi:hypothetical protein